MKAVWLLVALAACSKPGGVLPDGAGGDDDGARDGTSADPFATPVGEWTWIDLPGMVCGNGAATGIGVNRSATSSDVLVFFEGGGACWDTGSCFTLNAAVHIQDGFTATTLQADLHYFPFDRTDPADPLSAPTYIYVPYCTGDLHAGIETTTYDVAGTPKTVHHVGSINTQTMIDRVRAAYPAAPHVWVVGQSAGGYGATLNFHRFRTAWPAAELALLQDSSMFISIAANYGLWQSSWTLQLPPGCTNCEHDFRQLLAAELAAEPASRVGLLTFDNDTTIKLFFGYGLLDSIVAQVNSLIASFYTAPTTHVYEVAGTDHTMLGGYHANAPLNAWVRQWATGDPAWADVR
ncbi:MAG: pectin acetylesterase-family hydrolase [Kofleriaceae bacterium]